MRGGQSWSIDVVIGVLIFLLVIGIFYALITKNVREDTSNLEIASETIAVKLTEEGDNVIVEENSININAIEELLDKEYELLKQELGVDSDFCIFLEDDNGNVINVTRTAGSDEYTYIGIGSERINVSNSRCGLGALVN